MGNQLDREYEVEAELTRSDATGGLNGGWKIFKAKKKSSGEDVSLWIFDKKVLKGLPKTTRHRYYALLRQEFTVLARLIHPNVLRVLQPISETKRGFMAETEPVFASLANLLGDHTNLRPSPELKNTTLDPFDVKMGVLEITEALAFLHGNANMIHRNVCPHSILLTTKGSWKLAGFAFAVLEKDRDKNQLHLDDDGPSTFRQAPSLDYVAPETVLTAQQGFKMDMWSLGMTLWEATTGKPALVSVASQQMKGPRIEAVRDYKLAIGQFFPLRSGMLQRRGTEGLPEVMEQLLCREPGQRADAQYFLRSDYFNDTLILTLMYLNDQNILQKDPASKAKFFKGLPHVLSKFSHRVVMQKVLPAIISELRNHELLPFVLPSLFQIVREHLSSQEFCKQVLPCLLPLMALEKPLKSSILLLSELETILKKAGAANIKSHILPMLVRGLEHSHPKMQEEVLKQIPKVVGILDFNFVKSLLPRLQALNLSTRLSPIRARIIICLEELVPHLDKSTIQDVVVPTLQECVQQERTAVVIMRVMVVFDLCSTRLGEQFTAINILPFAFPLCVEPSLNAEQFKFIIEQIKNMVQRVENTQLKKLPRTEQDAGSIMTPSGPRSSFSQEEPEREEFPQGQTNFTPPTSTSAMVTSPIKEVIGADFKDIITNVSKLSTQAQTRATAFISSLSSAPAASSTSVSSSSSSSSPALPSSSGPSSSASPNLPSSSTSLLLLCLQLTRLRQFNPPPLVRPPHR
ncbi:SCY1-like protein 2 [Balamuthia mandrillaris]